MLFSFKKYFLKKENVMWQLFGPYTYNDFL